MKNSDKVVLVLLRASTRTVLYEIIAVPGYPLLQAQRHRLAANFGREGFSASKKKDRPILKCTKCTL